MIQLGVAISTFFAALGVLAVPAGAATDNTATDNTAGRPGVLAPATHGWRFDASATTLRDVAHVIGADRLWERGVTGDGVGVALVDTGVVPVDGLTSGNVANGPDLSFESQDATTRYLDTFGHGTHLAGIIAGTDGTDGTAGGFTGIAPGARLTSVKVGVSNGATDVTQAIAAIDWVVAHRNDDPAHPIRVLNLAYGTDGGQDYRVDPLTHAVENAWRAGIVVVAAAGNEGTARNSLVNPAYDPYVLAVGAAVTSGTGRTSDDTVADFSSRGSASRRVDLVAPGRSIVSLRDPGSAADADNATARVGARFFKGSGTSQASAVVSGAVALLLQERPDLTPDQVKALLVASAHALPKGDAAGQGSGELNVVAASRRDVSKAAQRWPTSTGTGSVEAARGSVHIADGDVDLVGEQDIFGPFDTAAWAAASSAGTSWSGGTWMGHDWTGGGWTGTSWTATTWESHMWSSHMWSSHMWSSHMWSSHMWSSHMWSGDAWDSHMWSSHMWSSHMWSWSD